MFIAPLFNRIPSPVRGDINMPLLRSLDLYNGREL
jgi:hypothetical protein